LIVAHVGIDLLEIERLERALTRRPNLADRLFTPHERESCASRRRPAQHLAARFCAKEAVIKALRLDVAPWQEIEVQNGPEGAPVVKLSGTLSVHDGTVQVSLTHSGEWAGAVAIAGG
jgi:holo-[acyl-carrier protein] synthase